MAYSLLIPIIARALTSPLGILPLGLLPLSLVIHSTVTTGVPTICAALYMSVYTRSRNTYLQLMLFIIVMACAALFLFHSNSSYWFASYWLFIPLLSLVTVSTESHWLKMLCGALIASLVAHVVGATLYLYMIPTTPSFWSGLVVKVWYERLRIAGVILFAEALCRLLLNIVTLNLEVSHE